MTSTGVRVLFGREDEVATISALLDRARRGRAGVLAIVGAPGMGKSALIGRAQELAGEDFLRIGLSGVQAESALGHAGLFVIVRGLSDHLDELTAEQARLLRGVCRLGPPPPMIDRLAVHVALLLLLAGAAERRPVLVTVDDIQWLDVESRDALLFVARRLDSDATAMLIAARDDADVNDLLTRGAALPAMRIGPLPADGITGLVARARGASPAPAVVAALGAATGGNPLALAEAARRLSLNQIVGAEPLPRALPLTASADQVYARRLDQLQPANAEALQFFALACGDDATIALRAAAGLGIGSDLVAQLEDDALVQLDDNRVALPHALLVTAAIARIPPERRRRWHRRLAEAASGTTDPAAALRRVWHLADAAAAPSAEVADLLAAMAADQDRISNWAAAARASERAAALTPDPAERAQRYQQAADAAGLAGYADWSLRLLDLAHAAFDDPMFRAGIDHARAVRHVLAGRPAVAWALLPAAADLLQDSDPERAAVVLTDAAMAAFLSGRLEEAQVVATRAGELSSATAVAISSGLVTGLVAVHLGDLAAGLPVLSRVPDMIEKDVLPDSMLEYLAPIVVALTWTGRYEDAARLTDRTIEQLSRQGALGLLPGALYAGAYVNAWHGELDRAFVRATAGHQAALEVGNPLWLHLVTGALALVEALRGNQDSCARWAERVQSLGADLDVQQPRDVDDALGLVGLCAGAAEQALAHLERAHRGGAAGGLMFGRPTTVDLVEAYVRAGRSLPDSIDRHLDAETPPGFALIEAQIWRCRALVSAVDPDEGFGRAIELYDRAGLVWQVARTNLNHGERLRRTGRRVDARQHLQRAFDEFSRLGAHAWADRAGAELASAGGSLARRGPRQDARLTTQELNVAQAVAGGATNREVSSSLFLSAKTVEMHLTRVYRKLGLRSRSELAAHFVRHPGPEAAGQGSVGRPS